MILATFATLIASQSVISGAYSLTRQTVHLGFCRPLKFVTLLDEESRVKSTYQSLMPYYFTVGLSADLGSSSALAGAFGVAISGALLMDTILLIALIMRTNRLSRWNFGCSCFVDTTTELLFAFSNLSKIPHGGWFPCCCNINDYYNYYLAWGGHLVSEVRKSREGSLVEC